MDMSDTQGYWQHIVSALHAQDTPAFVALVVDCLQEKRLNFKQLQSGLRQHCLRQVRFKGCFAANHANDRLIPHNSAALATGSR